jgi:hypothetical protein
MLRRMDRQPNRSWLAFIELMLASLAVVAIPLLAMGAPHPPFGGDDRPMVPVIAEAIAIVGLLWMLRIWGEGARDTATVWANRDLEPTTAPDDLRDEWPPDELPLEDTRTRGWLLARIEFAIGVAAAVVVPALWLASPTFVGSARGPLPALAAIMPFAAEAVILLAVAWMVRIWRGPTRDLPPAWRYRSR